MRMMFPLVLSKRVRRLNVLPLFLVCILQSTRSEFIINVSNSTKLKSSDVKENAPNFVWFTQESLLSFRECMCATSSTQCAVGLELIKPQIWKVLGVTKKEVTSTNPILYTREYTCLMEPATNHLTCDRNFMLLDPAHVHLFHFESECALLCVKVAWGSSQTAWIYSNDERVIGWDERHGMCLLTSDVVAHKYQAARTPTTETPRKTTNSASKTTAPANNKMQLLHTPSFLPLQLTDITDDKPAEGIKSTAGIISLICIVELLAIAVGVFFLCRSRCQSRQRVDLKNKHSGHSQNSLDKAKYYFDNESYSKV